LPFLFTIGLTERTQKMSSWLIIVTGVIYGYIAVEQGFKGNMPMAVVYGGYSVSNFGLVFLVK